MALVSPAHSCAATLEEATEALGAAGATVTRSVSTKTDLVFAGVGSNVSKAEALNIPVLDERALFGVIKDWVLCRAATNGSVAELKRLLEQGADPNAQSMSRSVLETALTHHNNSSAGLEMAKTLVAAGASTSSRGSRGTTPLFAACTGEGAMPELVAFLISKGADPNAAATDGRTPLWQALFWESSRVAKVLLNAGACAAGGKDATGASVPLDSQCEPVHKLAGKLRDAELLAMLGAKEPRRGRSRGSRTARK